MRTRKKRSLKSIRFSATTDGHERHAPRGHASEDVPVELEPELHPPVREQDGSDGQRPAEVADEHADRALVEDDDEQDRRADREQDVREAAIE